MHHHIHGSDDLAWLLRHTRAFRGGHVVEFQVSRRRLFDENLDRDVLAGTTATMMVRYAVAEFSDGRGRRIERVARLRFHAVSDFSFFEQEGTNSGGIEALQAERYHGRLRFWFDQYGEVYVVCEEVDFEEVSLPGELPATEGMREWVFQAREGVLPTAEWLLGQLDRRGVPCVWRAHRGEAVSNGFSWSGVLSRHPTRADANGERVLVRGYGALDGGAFGLSVQVEGRESGAPGLLHAVAEIVTAQFPGEQLSLP